MSARILVVDDESDMETLFRQQFRRDLKAGRFGMEFADLRPAGPRDDRGRQAGATSSCCSPTSTCPA